MSQIGALLGRSSLTFTTGKKNADRRMSWQRSVRLLRLASRLSKSRYSRASSRRRKRRSAELARRKNSRRRKPSWLLSVLRSKLPVNASGSCSSSWRHSMTKTLLMTKVLRTSLLKSPLPLQAKNCHEAQRRRQHRLCHQFQGRSRAHQLLR